MGRTFSPNTVNPSMLMSLASLISILASSSLPATVTTSRRSLLMSVPSLRTIIVTCLLPVPNCLLNIRSSVLSLPLRSLPLSRLSLAFLLILFLPLLRVGGCGGGNVLLDNTLPDDTTPVEPFICYHHSDYPGCFVDPACTELAPCCYTITCLKGCYCSVPKS